MLPRDYVSASQINMYLRCPNQYKFRYVEGLVIPPGSALTRGKAVHAGQELNYQQKIETQKDLPLSDIQEFTAHKFEEYAEKTDFQKDDPGKVKDDAITLATLYHQEVAPNVQPMMVEERVEVPLADTVLVGYIDLIDTDGYIHDTKTVDRTPPAGEIEKSLQLTAYSLAYRELMGVEERGVKLDYLVNTKTPKVVQQEAKRTQKDIDMFLYITNHVIDAIIGGVFYPNPTNMMCNERWCGYYHRCMGV